MPSDKQGLGGVVAGGLKQGAKGLAGAAGKKLLSSASGRIGDTTKRLTEYAAGGGGPGLMSAITGGGDQGGGGKDKSFKVTNIVESIDVGVPLRVAYDQWTQFKDFPTFMKKVESVDQEEETKLQWRAQILWSHRNWESTITEQVPDKRIVWKSKGAKGYVDGAVTFHALGPDMTRIVVVLQYHPQGFFEKTGNLWRAPGRRARLELKHFARHVMTESILHPDDIQGWRGEIHEGEVVKDDETARREEQERAEHRRRDKHEDRHEGRHEDRPEEERDEPRRRSQPRRQAA